MIKFLNNSLGWYYYCNTHVQSLIVKLIFHNLIRLNAGQVVVSMDHPKPINWMARERC